MCTTYHLQKMPITPKFKFEFCGLKYPEALKGESHKATNCRKDFLHCTITA